MKDISFVTCYDKDCEEFAELLMTLVSENSYICNINKKSELFKKDFAVTSNEYVLTIGSKASKINIKSFKDTYNKYGIHIGFRGRKAWVSCEHFNWNKKNLREFHEELIMLLNELGMCTDDINDRIAENIKKAIITKSLSDIQGKNTTETIIMTSLTSAVLLSYMFYCNNSLFLLIKMAWNWIENIKNSSERKKEQYKLAIVLFYHKYINDFLEINNSKENEKNKMSF